MNTRTDVSLEGLINDAYEVAKTMVGQKEDIMPHFNVVLPSGEIMVLEAPWADEREKVAMVEMARHYISVQNARAYSIVSVAWEARLDKAESDEEMWRRPPSERVNRAEILLIVAATRSGRNRVSTWEVLRDWDGRCSGLKFRNQNDGIKGRMAGLFSSQPNYEPDDARR